MKFPKVTVILVSAALLFVLWDQTREVPEPLTADRLTNLAAQPAERGRVVDWVVDEIPRLCREATGAAQGSERLTDCQADAQSRAPACRRMAAEQFPSMVASEGVFRDLSITMMSCLVQQSRRIDSQRLE